MKVLTLNSDPVFEFPFLNAGQGPKTSSVDRLPVQIATVDQFPDGLAAIIVTSDLQGREHYQYQVSGALRLLGEWLPSVLKNSVLPLLNIRKGRIGVLLAGDFYTVPGLDKRGGSGDVTSVWEAFAQCFSWVVGVAGNHDTFGVDSLKPPCFEPPVYFLDLESISLEELTIAGISGIVGNPNKPWRKTEDEFLRFIHGLGSAQPDILLMHDGPDIPNSGCPGSSKIRETLSGLNNTLVIRGHKYWNNPLMEIHYGLQILNVNARVVILLPS